MFPCNKFALGVMLSKFSKGIGEFSSSDKLITVNFMFWLLILLLILRNSANSDGCKQLIKRKEENITFLQIPENNFKI